MKTHLRRLLVRALLAASLALLVAFAPLGWLGPLVVALQGPAAIVLLICLLGKLLYDTLFYDHYWP